MEHMVQGSPLRSDRPPPTCVLDPMSLQQFACRCLNLTITPAPRPDAAPSPTPATQYERVYVGDSGIHVTHGQLTMRQRTTTQDKDKIQWNTVSCLLCHTTVYRVANEVPHDFELRDGVVAPAEDYTEGEILRGRDGYVEVNVGSDGCLDAEAISAARDNREQYSEAFGLVLPEPPKPAPLAGTPQRPSSPQQPSTPRSYLPTLPPLFHPPPYSPSHPVFLYLSKTASTTSAQFRSQAEQAIEAFVNAQVEELLEKERHLRGEVDVIWSRWRENRRQARPDSPEAPQTTGAIPSHAAISVREFSPESGSGSGPVTQGSVKSLPVRRPSIPSTNSGPSMLSQSLRQSNFHAPAPNSSGSGVSTPSPQSQAPLNGHRDAGMRNAMDDSFAVSASYQIRAGDAMRNREEEQRRLKRLSQSKTAKPPPTVPEEQSPEEESGLMTPRNGVAEGKRKVTFQSDVKEEDGGSQPVLRRGDGDGDHGDGEATPALFDLDDELEGDQPSAAAEEEGTSTPEPATPRTKAKAKAKSKTSTEPPQIGRKAAIPALLTVNLGPSPGTSKPKTSHKAQSPATAESPKARQVRPGEDKLLDLVAANYPSHRAAWRPNGKAWDFFDARRKFADSPDTASLTSEESNGGKWDNPSQFATSLPVRIAAGPLAASTDLDLEPKTSLHNEPGALVPAFKVITQTTQTPRQTRERTYALRDLARSVDPGPVLELQAAEDAAEDTDEEEEDALGEMSSAERVRRRTMRIVQRQSGVPDAGMWRSVAS